MREAALSQARALLGRAKNALARLKGSQSFEEAQEAWDQFLHTAHRVYPKLRAGAHETQSWAWFMRKLDDRKTDPLLEYLHQARNSDEHRLDSALLRNPASLLIQAHRGSVQVDQVQLTADGWHIGWRAVDQDAYITVSRHLAHLELMPVKNANRHTKVETIYPVPKSHRGKPIGGKSAYIVGTLAIIYLEDLLVEAESLLR